MTAQIDAFALAVPCFSAGTAAGYAQSSDTSRDAASRIANLGERHAHVIGALVINGPSTADEIAAYLRWEAFVTRPRVTELCNRGLVRDTGGRRRTPRGRTATVWELVGLDSRSSSDSERGAA
jgi:predicted ArsR family transcriptional regulator